LRGFAEGAVQVVNFLICGPAENFAVLTKGGRSTLLYTRAVPWNSAD
jgi:hypothetical protein